MDDNPEIRDRLNVNKSTYHNKRPRERFICFIRGAKRTKINQLNGPSPIHDTLTWLSQSIKSIRNVCCWLGMQKNLPWKRFRTALVHYNFPSTSASQQAWRMRKRYHLLLLLPVERNLVPRGPFCHALEKSLTKRMAASGNEIVLNAELRAELTAFKCLQYSSKYFTFPGITMWVVSLMFQNLVSGLYCLVKVLVQNFSIKIMTRSTQNMQARIFS